MGKNNFGKGGIEVEKIKNYTRLSYSNSIAIVYIC